MKIALGLLLAFPWHRMPAGRVAAPGASCPDRRGPGARDERGLRTGRPHGPASRGAPSRELRWA
jgi:hypothetical protein